MTLRKNEAFEVQYKLEEMRKLAEEIEALVYTSNPDTATKMRKIGAYAGRLATCLRLHGQIPAERKAPPLIEAAKNVHQLHRSFKSLAAQLPKKE
jgi:hypothetical protein